MNIVVREATDADAGLIAELTRRAWAGMVNPGSRGQHETTLQVIQHLRAGGGFVLQVDAMPAGCVRWLPLDDDPDIWEILRMSVLPDWRGNNLSQHLLEAVIHHGLLAGVGEMRLAVRADQPKLLDLYAAFGFELAAELEYSHANRLEAPPLIMRRLLRR